MNQNAKNDETGEWENLNDIETVLTPLGIKLRETKDTWRSVDDVLADIGEKWETWDQTSRYAAATAIAGTRQRENVVSLFENWDQVQKYANIAADAYGTAAEKLTAYTDSVAAAKARITAAVEGLVYDLKTEKGLNGLYTTVADVVDNLDAVVVTLATLLAVLKRESVLTIGSNTAMRINNKMINTGFAHFGRYQYDSLIPAAGQEVRTAQRNTALVESFKQASYGNYTNVLKQYVATMELNTKALMEELNTSTSLLSAKSQAIMAQQTANVMNGQLTTITAQELTTEYARTMANIALFGAQKGVITEMTAEEQSLLRLIQNQESLSGKDAQAAEALNKYYAATIQATNNMKAGPYAQAAMGSYVNYYANMGKENEELLGMAKTNRMAGFMSTGGSLFGMLLGSSVGSAIGEKTGMDSGAASLITSMLMGSMLSSGSGHLMQTHEAMKGVKTAKAKLNTVRANIQNPPQRDLARDVTNRSRYGYNPMSQSKTSGMVTAAVRNIRPQVIKDAEKEVIEAKSKVNKFSAVMGYGSLALTGLLVVVSALTKAHEKAITTLQENYSARLDAYNNTKDMTSTAETYDKLVSGVNAFGENVSLSTEDYEKFLEASNALAEAFPSLVTYIDDAGNKFVGMNSTIGEVTNSVEDLIAANKLLANSAYFASDSLWKNSSVFEQDLEEVRENIEEAQESQESNSEIAKMFTAEGGKMVNNNVQGLVSELQQQTGANVIVTQGVADEDEEGVYNNRFHVQWSGPGEERRGAIIQDWRDQGKKAGTGLTKEEYIEQESAADKARFEANMPQLQQYYEALASANEQEIKAYNASMLSSYQQYMDYIAAGNTDLADMLDSLTTEESALVQGVLSNIDATMDADDIKSEIVALANLLTGSTAQDSIFEDLEYNYVKDQTGEKYVYDEQDEKTSFLEISTKGLLDFDTLNQMEDYREQLRQYLSETLQLDNLTTNADGTFTAEAQMKIDLMTQLGFEYDEDTKDFVDAENTYEQDIKDSLMSNNGITATEAQTAVDNWNLSTRDTADVSQIYQYVKKGYITDTTSNETIDSLLEADLPSNATIGETANYGAGLVNAGTNLNSRLNEYFSSLTDESENTVENVSQAFSDLPSNLRNSIRLAGNEMLKEQASAGGDIEKETAAQAKAMAEVWDDYALAIKDAQVQMAKVKAADVFGDIDAGDNGWLDTWTEMANMMKAIDDSFDMLKEAQEEQEDHGRLSVATVLEMLSVSDDYIQALEVEDGKIRLKSNATEIMAQVQLDAAKAQIRASMAEDQEIMTAYEHQDGYIESQNETLQADQQLVEGSNAVSEALANETNLVMTIAEAYHAAAVQKKAYHDGEIEDVDEVKQIVDIQATKVDYQADVITSEVTKEDYERAAADYELKQNILDSTLDSYTKFKNTYDFDDADYTALDLVKAKLAALNQEFAQLQAYQKDGGYDISESYFGERRSLLKEEIGLLEKEMANADNSKEYYEFLEEYHQAIVDLNKLDSEEVEYNIGVLEAKREVTGAISDELVAQYEALRGTEYSLQNQYEVEKKIYDIKQAQLDNQITILNRLKDYLQSEDNFFSTYTGIQMGLSGAMFALTQSALKQNGAKTELELATESVDELSNSTDDLTSTNNVLASSIDTLKSSVDTVNKTIQDKDKDTDQDKDTDKDKDTNKDTSKDTAGKQDSSSEATTSDGKGTSPTNQNQKETGSNTSEAATSETDNADANKSRTITVGMNGPAAAVGAAAALLLGLLTGEASADTMTAEEEAAMAGQAAANGQPTTNTDVNEPKESTVDIHFEDYDTTGGQTREAVEGTNKKIFKNHPATDESLNNYLTNDKNAKEKLESIWENVSDMDTSAYPLQNWLNFQELMGVNKTGTLDLSSARKLYQLAEQYDDIWGAVTRSDYFEDKEYFLGSFYTDENYTVSRESAKSPDSSTWSKGGSPQGDAVRKIQAALVNLGYVKENQLTKNFSRTTEKAIKEFQESIGKEATGVVDASTMNALYRAVQEKYGLNQLGAQINPTAAKAVADDIFTEHLHNTEGRVAVKVDTESRWDTYNQEHGIESHKPTPASTTDMTASESSEQTKTNDTDSQTNQDVSPTDIEWIKGEVEKTAKAQQDSSAHAAAVIEEAALADHEEWDPRTFMPTQEWTRRYTQENETKDTTNASTTDLEQATANANASTTDLEQATANTNASTTDLETAIKDLPDHIEVNPDVTVDNVVNNEIAVKVQISTESITAREEAGDLPGTVSINEDSSQDTIKKLQAALQKLGYNASTTGVYDAYTQYLVKQYREDKKITVNGSSDDIHNVNLATARQLNADLKDIDDQLGDDLVSIVRAMANSYVEDAASPNFTIDVDKIVATTTTDTNTDVSTGSGSGSGGGSGDYTGNSSTTEKEVTGHTQEEWEAFKKEHNIKLKFDNALKFTEGNQVEYLASLQESQTYQAEVLKAEYEDYMTEVKNDYLAGNEDQALEHLQNAINTMSEYRNLDATTLESTIEYYSNKNQGYLSKQNLQRYKDLIGLQTDDNKKYAARNEYLDQIQTYYDRQYDKETALGEVTEKAVNLRKEEYELLKAEGAVTDTLLKAQKEWLDAIESKWESNIEEANIWGEVTDESIAMYDEYYAEMEAAGATERQLLEIQKAKHDLQLEQLDQQISLLENAGVQSKLNQKLIQQKIDLAVTDSERVEYQKELNDAIKEEQNLIKQTLQYRQDLLTTMKNYWKYTMDYKMEVAKDAKGNTVTDEEGNIVYTYSIVPEDSEDEESQYDSIVRRQKENLEQQLETAKSLMRQYRQMAAQSIYDGYIALGYSASDAKSLAITESERDSDYQEQVKDYIAAYEALGDLIVENFNDKIDEIERRLQEVEDSRQDEWGSTFKEDGTVETYAKEKIQNYYNQLIELQKEIQKAAEDTLNEIADGAEQLTDEQVYEFVQKYNDAIKQIHEYQISSLEDQIDYQESVYSAATAEVQDLIDQLEKRKELVEESYDDELEALQDKQQSIERTNKLLELQLNLENAEKSKTRVYREGIGWVNIMPRIKKD